MAESILRLAVRDGAIREGELLSWTSVCSRVTSVQLRGPRGRKAAVPIRLNERPFTLFHHPEADRLLSTRNTETPSYVSEAAVVSSLGANL